MISSGKPRAYLKKSRPSTANMLAATNEQDHAPGSPTTPSRPATSHLFSSPRSPTPDTTRSPTPFTSARSRHTIHFSPDTVPEEFPEEHPDRPKTATPDRPKTSTPLSANRPHTPHRWATLARPKSRQRPASSGAWLNGDAGGERPVTVTSAGGQEEREKRRWSESLKKLFR
jgi:hypothetical protein